MLGTADSSAVEFTAMMLRFVYEYPERGRLAKAARQERRPLVVSLARLGRFQFARVSTLPDNGRGA